MSQRVTRTGVKLAAVGQVLGAEPNTRFLNPEARAHYALTQASNKHLVIVFCERWPSGTAATLEAWNLIKAKDPAAYSVLIRPEDAALLYDEVVVVEDLA